MVVQRRRRCRCNDADPPPQVTRARGPCTESGPAQMPKLSSQCSVAKFDDFQKQWRFYKASVDMPQNAVTSYLMNCLEEEVKNDVLAADADIHEKTEDEVLAAIKQYAVQRRAISSLKVDVWQMSQGEGESVHKFYARVKELASQCQFTVACTNNTCPDTVSRTSAITYTIYSCRYFNSSRT